jgi:hypothetical protein
MAYTNTHITTLRKVIPLDIRLEVYLKAKKFIETNQREHGLCILFPILLWNLKSFTSDNPIGNDWDYNDTSIAFPELTREIIHNIISSYSVFGKSTIQLRRLVYINKFIKKLQHECKENNSTQH